MKTLQSSLCVLKKLHTITFLLFSGHGIIMPNDSVIILLLSISHIFMSFNHCFSFYMSSPKESLRKRNVV